MKAFRHSTLALPLSVIVLAVVFIVKAEAEEQNGMVLVPAGRWTIGTSESERAELGKRFDCHPTWLGDDLPRREAALAAFWIDRYPVTNGQYLAFVEATGHPRPEWWGRWGGAFPTEYANHPVAGVSGKDAAAYAKWAGKRLPTAEEWQPWSSGLRPSTLPTSPGVSEPVRASTSKAIRCSTTANNSAPLRWTAGENSFPCAASHGAGIVSDGSPARTQPNWEIVRDGRSWRWFPATGAA